MAPRVQRAALALTLALPLASSACAGACQRVQADRAAFLARETTASTPHLQVSVPFDAVSVLMSRELARLPAYRVPLPRVSGVSLGQVTARVSQLRLVPAPSGAVGFRVVVSLLAGRQALLDVELDARTTPRVDAARGTVTVVLSAADVRSVSPRLAPGAQRGLRDYAWSQLPAAVRAMVSKKQLESLLAGASDQLLREVAQGLRKEVAGQIGEVARFELELPPLPLAALALSSRPGELLLSGRLDLPVAEGVRTDARHPASHPNAVELRISGEAATALGNWAIAQGEIPGRYGLDGDPDPAGPLLAALDWRGADPRPLRVRLWTAPDAEIRGKKDRCAQLELSATPSLRGKQGKIEVSSRDLRIDEVRGSAGVKAAVFFSGLGRRSFELAETVAGQLDFELGGAPLSATVYGATLDGDDLVFAVRLGPGAR